MVLGEFVVKYYGKKVDYDGVFGAQCVDLFRQYAKEVWGLPPLEGLGDGGASLLYTNYEKLPLTKKYLDRMQCAMKGQPIPPGAVVIFGPTAANKYGHVGICINTEGEKINLLEQDGYKQDGVKIAVWNYDRVLGWLTKREAA